LGDLWKRDQQTRETMACSWLWTMRITTTPEAGV
jgi:hypothetical protein